MLSLISVLSLLILLVQEQNYQLQVLDPRALMEETEGRQWVKAREGKLTLSLSTERIDFGQVKPTNPVLREATLTVEGADDFSLIAFKDHPLRAGPPRLGGGEAGPPRLGGGEAGPPRLGGGEAGPPRLGGGEAGSDIPDTTCDDGTCSPSNSSAWTNPLAFGFGISLDGEQYQQLSHEAKHTLVRNRKEVKLIHKLNVAKIQPPGFYTNTIFYILIPNY